MPKNIILLCDGTSNEIARNRTNILRLYGCLKKDEHQLVFYLPLCEYRHIPKGARVHASVFVRRGTKADYPQPNIPEDHVVVGEVEGDA